MMLKPGGSSLTASSAAGPSLTRRRGVTRSRRHRSSLASYRSCRRYALRHPLRALATILLLCSTLAVLLYWRVMPSRSESSAAASRPFREALSQKLHSIHLPDSVGRTARKALPGVPNLLRGNVPDVPVPPRSSGDTAAMHASSPKAQHVAAANPPHSKPLYPYSLALPPADYEISRDFRVLGGSRFTEYTDGGTPYHVETPSLRAASDRLARARRSFVRTAMDRSWKAYVDYCFGADELRPWSKAGNNNWGGGMGMLLVDSLDTLWLMNMTDAFWQARDWVRDHWNPEAVHQSVSVFETTIRQLGGLLAAYDWSGDRVFLDKAEDLGQRLLKSFEGSSTGLPFGMVDLTTGRHSNLGWTGGAALVAEIGTLQVEFRYLAHATGKPQYAEPVERAFQILKDMAPEDGLYPYAIANNPADGKARFTNDKVTFGAMGDSFYEYMLKIWIQGGKVEPMYRDMYDQSIDSMHKHLLQFSTPSGLAYIADRNNGVLDHKMDHLVCFMGGALALGAYLDPRGLDSERAQRDLKTGKALTYTCYQMYARMNTGISPEFIQFHDGKDFQIGRGAPHYLLRPEAVESLFILHQLTGDPIYREWGWEMFQAIEKYCRTDVAYGALSNVQDTNGRPRDSMESFFLAETLKYFYLLFDPDTEVDILHKHVFNTEAHPLRIFPEYDKKAS